MRRVTLDFQGERVEGEQVEFSVASEPWSEYVCEDGTKLKYKSVVHRIVRLAKRNPDGEPIYVVQAAPPHVVAHVPEHLMLEGR
jgi:hypothetical protein